MHYKHCCNRSKAVTTLLTTSFRNIARLNNDADHKTISPAWIGIDEDGKNDDLLCWTLAGMHSADDNSPNSAIRFCDPRPTSLSSTKIC